MWNRTKKAFQKEKKMDVHTKLMKAYKSVPPWWFHVILVVNIAVVIFACEYYKETLQLRYWGVLLACAIALFFTLPIGIIVATTNQVKNQSGPSARILPFLLHLTKSVVMFV